MDKELAILAPFFEDPTGTFHIREIARLTHLNHMTARSYLNRFVKEGLLTKKATKIYATYTANPTNKHFTNLKLYHNLEQLRIAHIIEDLENTYDYPVIILFGSYATATNTHDSDIDLFILTNIQKEFNTEHDHKTLKRKISLHKFTEKEFHTMKNTNPELINNIINGITLAGKLEVL